MVRAKQQQSLAVRYAQIRVGEASLESKQLRELALELEKAKRLARPPDILEWSGPEVVRAMGELGLEGYVATRKEIELAFDMQKLALGPTPDEEKVHKIELAYQTLLKLMPDSNDCH